MILKNFYKASAILVSGAFLLAACGQPATDKKAAGDIPVISAENIKAHVTFLADDAMGGRDTGSKEYQIAANYVATQYKLLGLKPGGENGSYFQTVNFSKSSIDQEATTVSITRDGKTTALKMGVDFHMSADKNNLENLANGEIVFVGHGISAAEAGHDDFAGIEVTGKILARLQGAPESASEAVKAAAHDKKLHGAVGSITLYTPAKEEARPFEKIGKYFTKESFKWIAPEDEEAAEAEGINVFMSPEMGVALLDGVGLTFEQAIEAASMGDFVAVPLGVSLFMKQVTKLSDPVSSPNVAGVLKGSDPSLSDQYVIISAHLDHVGTCPHREKDTAAADDTICNGALDNASGVATMIEAARAFVDSGETPRRSLMFLAVTAEEKGLLGAEYFAHYPTVDKSKIVANVNLDMPVLLYDFADVVAFGGEHSTMGEIAARATARIGMSVAEDPMPEENLFTRSDHYRFVQQGIPSVFLMSGPTEVGETEADVKERNGYKTFYKFLQTNYHSPADDLNQPLNWEAAAKFSLVNYLIMDEIANADVEPRWYEGNSFGDKFAPDAPRAPVLGTQETPQEEVSTTE